MHDELTASDLAKIEAEIEERKLILRPKLIEAVKEARAQGVGGEVLAFIW